MQAPRYPFTIDRTDDAAIVCMNYDGLVRCRTMPLYILDALVRACEQVRSELLPGLLRDSAFCDAVPAYPRCSGCLHFRGLAGVCDVEIVASRDESTIEFCSAFYDVGDEEAPAIVLVSEQLDDFIRTAKAVLIAAAAKGPPTA